jgi:hypothetical protein
MRNVRPTLLAHAILSLVLAACATGCKSGGCDSKGLQNVQKALGKVDADMRGPMGMAGIGEACSAGLPKGIAKALNGVGNADPAMRTTIMAKGLAEAPEFTGAACPKFAETFGGMAAASPETKAQLLYTGCEYAKLDLVTAEEFEAAANRDFVSALAAPPLYKWLIDHGVEKSEARNMMRTIVGL